jgi:hypothetical protein
MRRGKKEIERVDDLLDPDDSVLMNISRVQEIPK